MRNTRNSKNSEFGTKFTYHKWVWYAYSYLSLARIGIEELEKEIKTPNTITSFENYFSYRKKYLIIPIIYNIKHAIEIITKALKIQIDKKYVKSHDLDDLFNVLKELIRKSGLKIQKPNKINELAQIIKKYYKLEFWDRKLINTAFVFDLQNDVFKFPDNSANFILDSENLTSISKKNIRELLDDITKLGSLLGIITQEIKKAKNPTLYEKMDRKDKETWEKEKKIIFNDYE